MTETDILAQIETAGGMAFAAEDQFFVALPLDGEWVTGIGFDLEDTYGAVIVSDGEAMTKDGVQVVPYLDRDEAFEAAEELGTLKTLVDASAKPSPAA